MANFDKAFEKTVAAEGGYVNNPNDKGGETYMGVTRKNHPSLAMWEWVDRFKVLYKGKELNKKLKENSIVQKDVKTVYRTLYWNLLKLDLVKSQRVANQFFDNAINCGVVPTIKMMQRLKNQKETGRMSESLINLYK